MKKALLLIAMMCGLSFPAYAERSEPTLITTTTGIDDIVTIQRTRTPDPAGWRGDVVISGTFASNTIHFLVSVDGGTTKVPLDDLTDVAYTKTAEGTVELTWGWPTTSDQSAIIYASVGGDSPGAPTLTITVDDNR